MVIRRSSLTGRRRGRRAEEADEWAEDHSGPLDEVPDHSRYASKSVSGGTSGSGTSTSRRSSSQGGRSKTPNKHQRRVRRSKSPGVRETVRESIKRRCSFDEAYERNRDNDDFEVATRRSIPADFFLLASQDEVSQSQEDYFAMEKYNLPKLPGKISGKAGSVATCALLELMHENPDQFIGSTNSTITKKRTKTKNNGSHNSNSMTCYEVLHQIPQRIKRASKLTAKPTISSSRPLGPPRSIKNGYAPFRIVPAEKINGTRRALLIGVTTTPDKSDKSLQAPPNDIAHMRHFLIKHGGFKSKDITILLEDETSGKQPTRKNIMMGLQKLVQLSHPNDVCFVQFSGHGGRSSHNLHILPCDVSHKKSVGPITDEDIMKHFIKAMPFGVHTTMLMDCCYSGTVGDLPYLLQAGATKQKIEVYFDTDTCQEMLDWERQNGVLSLQEHHQNKSTQRLLQENRSKDVDPTTSLSESNSSLSLEYYCDDDDEDDDDDMDMSTSRRRKSSSKMGSSLKRSIKRTLSGGSKSSLSQMRMSRGRNSSRNLDDDAESSELGMSNHSDRKKRGSSLGRRVKRTLSSGPRGPRKSTPPNDDNEEEEDSAASINKKELPKRSSSFSGRLKRSLSSSGLAASASRRRRSTTTTTRDDSMDASVKSNTTAKSTRSRASSINNKKSESRAAAATTTTTTGRQNKQPVSRRSQLEKKLNKNGGGGKMMSSSSSSRRSMRRSGSSSRGMDASFNGSNRSLMSDLSESTNHTTLSKRSQSSSATKGSRRRGGNNDTTTSSRRMSRSSSQMMKRDEGDDFDDDEQPLLGAAQEVPRNTSGSRSSMRRSIKRTLSGGLSRRSSRKDGSEDRLNMSMPDRSISSSKLVRKVKRTLSGNSRRSRSKPSRGRDHRRRDYEDDDEVSDHDSASLDDSNYDVVALSELSRRRRSKEQQQRSSRRSSSSGRLHEESPAPSSSEKLRHKLKRTLSGGSRSSLSRMRKPKGGGGGTNNLDNSRSSLGMSNHSQVSSSTNRKKRGSSLGRRVKRTLSGGARSRKSMPETSGPKKDLPKRSSSFSGRLKRSLSSSGLASSRRRRSTTTSADDDDVTLRKKSTRGSSAKKSVTAKSSPKRCSFSSSSLAQEAEEKARQDAVERSKREAAEARSKKKAVKNKKIQQQPLLSAREEEEIARREAVERSRQEAQAARAAARRESVEKARQGIEIDTRRFGVKINLAVV